MYINIIKYHTCKFQLYSFFPSPLPPKNSKHFLACDIVLDRSHFVKVIFVTLYI